MSKFNENERVVLKPFIDGDPAQAQPAQLGTVIAVEGQRMYLVSVDKEYRDKRGDDGIREVPEDQIEVATPGVLEQYGIPQHGRDKRRVNSKGVQIVRRKL